MNSKQEQILNERLGKMAGLTERLEEVQEWSFYSIDSGPDKGYFTTYHKGKNIGMVFKDKGKWRTKSSYGHKYSKESFKSRTDAAKSLLSNQ